MTLISKGSTPSAFMVLSCGEQINKVLAHKLANDNVKEAHLLEYYEKEIISAHI